MPRQGSLLQDIDPLTKRADDGSSLRKIWNGFHFIGHARPQCPQGVSTKKPARRRGYNKCVESHFEKLERIWDDKYAARFEFWREYVLKVIYQYLECGDLHFGFARVKCEECGHEYLLAFSCKRRHFCPSCHQKRVVEYSEWLLGNVLKKVPTGNGFSVSPKGSVFIFCMTTNYCPNRAGAVGT